MANRVSVTILNNSDAVRQAKDEAIARALVAIGEVAEGHAKLACPVHIGRLHNSIQNTSDNDTVYVGTNVEYAPYVEYGTGRFAEGGGRSTPWTYQDDEGNWHTTSGQKPQPFLKPAIMDHVAEYEKIAEAMLKG